MKIKPTILLILFTVVFMISCSTDDSRNSGNTNNARVISITWQEYDVDQWRNNYKTTYTYQGNNTVASSSLTQNYDGTTWYDDKRSFYTLYSSSQVSEQIEQKVSITAGGWVNNLRNTFTYDANGQCIKKVNEIWTPNNNWFLRYKNEYLYDSNSFMVTDQISEWYDAPAVWTEPFEKFIFTNNADGKPIRTEFINEAGQIHYIEITTYDINGVFLSSERFSEDFNGVSYVSLRTEQTTLANGNIDKITKTYYNPDGSSYRQSRFLYEY